MIARLGLCLALAILGSAHASAEEVTISGRYFQAIQMAMPEFNRGGRPLKDFQILVDENDFQVVVSFLPLDRPQGLRGGGDLNVILRKDDLTVTQVVFSR